MWECCILGNAEIIGGGVRRRDSESVGVLFFFEKGVYKTILDLMNSIFTAGAPGSHFSAGAPGSHIFKRHFVCGRARLAFVLRARPARILSAGAPGLHIFKRYI